MNISDLDPGQWAMTSQIKDTDGVLIANVVLTPSTISPASKATVSAVNLSVDEVFTKDFPVTQPGKYLYIDVFCRSDTGFNQPTRTWAFETEKNITPVPLS
jgi:hypothetical protein